MAEQIDFETRTRRCWSHMITRRLPEVAAMRSWPVASAAGLERILLDHLFDAPWEEVLDGPSPSAADALDLVFCNELAGRLIDGTADISELNRRSLAMRAAKAEASERAVLADLSPEEFDRFTEQARGLANEIVARLGRAGG